MSHETLASVWIALTELHDPAAGLREAVGHLALKSILSSSDDDTVVQQFRQLALELSFSFDVIRLLWGTRSWITPSLQDDVVAAIAYLLSRLSDPHRLTIILFDRTTNHLLEHVLLASLCILQTCVHNCRSELKNALLKQAHVVIDMAPKQNGTPCLFSMLLDVLVEQCRFDVESNRSMVMSRVAWKDLSNLPSNERNEFLSKIFEQATDVSVSVEERMQSTLDICRLYWDTDCVLMQACGTSRRPHQLAKVFHVASESDAIQVALDVRFALQEDFAMLAMRGSATSDVVQAQAHIFFRPYLKLKCLQDDCNCSFGPKYTVHVLALRSKQRKMHRATISTAYIKSQVSQIDHAQLSQACVDFAGRLRRWTGPTGGPLDDPPDLSRAEELIPTVLPLRPRVPCSKSVDGTSDTVSGQTFLEADPIPFGVQLKAQHQQQLQRRQSRPKPPSVRSAGRRPTITETMSAPVHEMVDLEDSMADPGFVSSTTLTSTDVRTPQDFENPGSVTTATSSSNCENGSAASAMPITHDTEKQMDTSQLPEAMDMLHQDRIIGSPFDFEKSYPEVVINPISSIQEDNLSLFSDGASMPITAVSAKRPTAKKWPGLFGASKTSKVVATPSARFFTSGKFLIAWTRYGGACIDLNETSEHGFFGINVGDIAMAAGGTRRFAVVARVQETCTVLVYNLGDEEPGLRMNLGSCPKSMDLSKDDAFLAIKYLPVVRIFDLNRGTKIDHKLPRVENVKPGPVGHLVSFSHDSQSFMASTRLGPEKVYTYWSPCMDRNGHVVVQSNAPCGNIGDHGLTSLHVAGPPTRGFATGFLSTFTEKGNPVILPMSSPSSTAIPLRDTKNVIGTRIHASAMHVDPRTRKANVVLVNQNNDVFWVSDVFTRNQDVSKLKSLKRAKSQKPEVLVAMPTADEASVFWIDQKSQSGILVKYGRNGGSSRSTDIRLDIEPLCCV